MNQEVLASPLYEPNDVRVLKSEMYAFKKHVESMLPKPFDSYADFHQFSVEHKEHFWREILEYFSVQYSGRTTPVLKENNFDGYTWFPEVKMSFAKNLLERGKNHDVAIVSALENGSRKELRYGELKSQVGFLSNYLKQYLAAGDVVGAYMPNVPETIVTMLAANTMGATFTSTSSDFGVEGVVDRFSESKPKIVIAAIGYEYGGKYFDLTERIIELEKRLTGTECFLLVDVYQKGIDLSRFTKAKKFSDIFSDASLSGVLKYEEFPFSHPLYIMYSSGTTGKPKCIVHSQGGTLLQHIKELGLHSDLKREKTIMFFTTCGWMMWNWFVSSLYFGSKIILYEGSPAFPSPKEYFEIINREEINIFGTSPKFLKALEDVGTVFPENHFPTLETILSTGSPLLPEQYDFVYQKVKAEVLLASISGGTDILGCFMLGNPMLPVYRGEIQCLGLGMDVKAFSDDGKELTNSEGELVCVSTFPSRPLYFLNDLDQNKIKDAYFNKFTNVWYHGDYIKITDHGSVVVFGRSDATLNPGGVRIGTAEIYRQTESLSFIQDSICVGKNTNGDVDVILFVKLKTKEVLTPERIKEIKQLIKNNTTPRHVPREIHAVSDIPYTRSGKKVELAVNKIINGKEINNLEAIANAECLEEFKKFI
ncbi:MAG: acetoacetate--CoA ligase [Bacteriovoracaceae bacterium]|nr:acetoacetate--CoA ligase [Bacteriovoracaceae bacterium]